MSDTPVTEPSAPVVGKNRKPRLDRSKTGRAKGTPNKTTALLKEAIILAAEAHGNDGKGKDGLKGYCQHLAATEPKAFCGLLGKVLPLQLADADGNNLPAAALGDIDAAKSIAFVFASALAAQAETKH